MGKTTDIRTKILQISYKKQCGHIGSNLSIVDILDVIYGKILNPYDKFVLSKGHAGLALYATLNQYGILSDSELQTYYDDDSLLNGHVSHNASGVFVSTGALGHGASIACGVALSSKINGSNSKVYTIIGDGECQQGSIWEMAMFAHSYQLSNLTMIVDNNKLQALGNLIDRTSLKDKWNAFGWTTLQVNGHNQNQLKESLETICSRPKCIIAYTIKGYGVSFMENNNDWHYNTLSKQTYDMALKGLYEK